MPQSDHARARATSFDDIPLIDIAPLRDPAHFEETAQQLVQTARDIGFFYVTGHGVPADLRARAFAASRRFFDLREADKASVAVNQNQRGWMAQGQTTLEGSKTHDAKEVFFWGFDTAEDDPSYRAGVPMVAPNQWPTAVAPWLQTEITPYYAAVLDLSRLLLSALAAGLGQDPAFFAPHYKVPLGRGQLVYYPPQEAKDDAAQRLGAAPHTDFGVLTVLAQDDLGGLQVRAPSGDWIEAPPVPDSFVCNIGDLLQMWTGGQLRSTVHRVINRARVPRYSIPIFCDPGSTTPIDPGDFGRPTDTEITTAGAHIAGRNRKNFTQYR